MHSTTRIFQGLKSLSCLTYFNFSGGYGITSRSSEFKDFIGDVLTHNHNLKELDLTYTPCIPTSMFLTLAHVTHIVKLIIRQMSITNEAADNIAVFFSRSNRV